MKVGIITFIDTMNYGALLQGFALCKVITQMGFEAKVVNYRFQDFKKDYYVTPKFSPRFLLSMSGLARYILNRSIAQHEKARFYKSRNFVSRNIPITPLCYSSADINALGMQVHVCGSDQIWNPSITNGFLDAFFGGSSTGIKKISFSASSPEITQLKARQNEFIRLVKQMDRVAVREQELQEYLLGLGITSTVTVDPTLLLNKEEYIGIATEVRQKRPYLFIYNLGRKDCEMLTYARKLAQKNNWDIIEIPTYKDFTTRHTQIFNAAPDEFLGYIINAEYVITNSFHGTVLSIILEKNFSAFSANARSSRITNVLDKLDLASRLNPAYTPAQTSIDYNTVRTKLATLKESSLEYLNNAINQNK